ncbi:hypothetical protein TNCV_1573461 [Trichonephila clavipes]|nr:hypothetical protein TNCV_1573461 [Trichonephila clavipes]
MSLSSFRVQQDATGHQSIASTEKRDEHPPLSACGRMSLSSFRVLQDATGQQSSSSTEKGDEHPPPSVCGRMSLSSFSLHHDVTGQQGSVSTKKRIRKPTVAASAVGCRCHSSAGNNTRTDSRVVPRRKKGDEHPTSRVLGRMSLSAFRVQQDATGHRSIASTEKVTNTDRGVATVGCRCHRSACTKMRPDSRVVPRRKKVTNTQRRAYAVGCPCHRPACTKTQPDSRVVPDGKRLRTPNVARPR